MAPSTSPRHDRAGLRLWSPAFFAVAIIACGAMYGAGFGIGRVLDGSGSHHPSATVPRSIDQQAVSTLENGLGLMKSARGTLDEYVLPILPDAGQKSPCTKPSDVVDKINDAITQRTQAVDEFVGPLGQTDSRAAALVTEFKTMVSRTNAADRRRIVFVDGDYATWQRSGCTGSAPTDASTALSDFETANSAAQDAKRAFVAEFNPAAARFGLQSDWSASDL